MKKKKTIAKRVKTFLNDSLGKKKKKSLIDKPEYQQKVERVYSLIKDGMSKDEVYAILLVEDNDFNEESFKELLEYSFKYSENEALRERENAWQTHMARYENVYEQAMRMVGNKNIPLDLSSFKDFELIRVKAQQALQALKYKEELIGLHDKKVIIEFNDISNEATVVDNPNAIGRGNLPGYNMDNLALLEKIELLALIKEARTTPPTGVQRVVIKQRKIEIDLQSGNRQMIEQSRKLEVLNVKDIEFEEMPVDIVSRMKNTREIEPEPDVDPHIIDSRSKEVIPNKTAQDTKDNIQNKVLEKLREQLKEKNERKKNKKA